MQPPKFTQWHEALGAELRSKGYKAASKADALDRYNAGKTPTEAARELIIWWDFFGQHHKLKLAS
jgi:hypothetical protein